MSVSVSVSRGASALVGCVVAAGLVLLPAAPASADVNPADPGDPTTPKTAAAKGLPTTQINGVAWDQEVIGNTVYVAGEFTAARPAGAAPGVNEVPRSNLLAYDIRTGVLSTTWVPSVNAVVNDIEASPDGSRLYIGGNFTTVNGATHRRIAALDPTTGARIASFNPNPNGNVYAVAPTNTTVYFGGVFGTVKGVTRPRFAAARASDGAVLDWAPAADTGYPWAMKLSPDGTQVLAGGSFTSVNGSNEPGPGDGVDRRGDRCVASVGGQQPDPQRRQPGLGDHLDRDRRRVRLRLRCDVLARRATSRASPRSTGTAARSSGSRTATATPWTPTPTGV